MKKIVAVFLIGLVAYSVWYAGVNSRGGCLTKFLTGIQLSGDDQLQTQFTYKDITSDGVDNTCNVPTRIQITRLNEKPFSVTGKSETRNYSAGSAIVKMDDWEMSDVDTSTALQVASMSALPNQREVAITDPAANTTMTVQFTLGDRPIWHYLVVWGLVFGLLAFLVVRSNKRKSQMLR